MMKLNIMQHIAFRAKRFPLNQRRSAASIGNPQKLSQLAPNIDQIRFTSSPLERTLATSKIICNAIGYDFTNTHTEAWIM
jgi:broad specificity phosphatase PhoE